MEGSKDSFKIGIDEYGARKEYPATEIGATELNKAKNEFFDKIKLGKKPPKIIEKKEKLMSLKFNRYKELAQGDVRKWAAKQ